MTEHTFPATLEVSGLHARRGDFTLGPVSFAISPGSTVALVGMNGSGKTTTLGCILGVTAHQGSITFLGTPVVPGRRDHLHWVGYVADTEETLLEELTAREYWSLVAAVRDSSDRASSLSRAEDLAERLSFDPGRRLIGTFSHGMKKKTQLVAALMHEPHLLVVDELSNGLDPMSADVASQLLMEAALTGTAILASSHDMSWVRHHADQVLLMHQGKLVRSGSPGELEKTGVRLEERFALLPQRSHA